MNGTVLWLNKVLATARCIGLGAQSCNRRIDLGPIPLHRSELKLEGNVGVEVLVDEGV